MSHIGWVAAAGLAGFVGNEIVAVYRIRVGRRIGSAALRADGMHARADGLTSLAVVLGAVGVALGFPAADPIIGLIIAAAILVVMVVAARDVFARLLDSVDPPALVDTAYHTLEHQPGVIGVQRVRMRWIGLRLDADVELDVDPRLSLRQAHDLAHHAEHALTHAIPKLDTAVVHAYPAHAH